MIQLIVICIEYLSIFVLGLIMVLFSSIWSNTFCNFDKHSLQFPLRGKYFSTSPLKFSSLSAPASCSLSQRAGRTVFPHGKSTYWKSYFASCNVSHTQSFWRTTFTDSSYHNIMILIKLSTTPPVMFIPIPAHLINICFSAALISPLLIHWLQVTSSPGTSLLDIIISAKIIYSGNCPGGIFLLVQCHFLKKFDGWLWALLRWVTCFN